MRAVKVLVAAIGVAASVVSVWAFVDKPYSDRPVEDTLLGEWSSEYSYPASAGRNAVSSVSTLFENGNYNVKGHHRVMVVKGDTEFGAIYELSGAGTWSSKRDRLYMTLASLKTSLSGVTIEGKLIPAASVPQEMADRFPKLEDFLADGTTQKYNIVSSDQERVVLNTTDPAGADLEIIMQRRQMR